MIAPSIAPAGELACRDQLLLELGRRVQQGERVGAGGLDILRARGRRRAGRRSRGAAQEPCSHVEPEHEARLGDGFEQRCAVAAAGVAVDLAHEPRVEQRSQRQ